MLARNKKTHRNRIHWLSVPLRTIPVNKTRPLGSVEILLNVKKPRIVFRHHAAFDTTEPPRKRLDGNSDIRLRIVRVVSFRFAYRRLQHPLDLRPAHFPDLFEKTRLLNQTASVLLP